MRRKTRENGLTNIEYAQADIMKLRSIGRRSTSSRRSACCIISRIPWQDCASSCPCSAPADSCAWAYTVNWPVNRWLPPGSSLRINDTLRMPREFGAVVRTSSTLEEQFEDLLRSGDFYSTSECRDLLFHVQEHRFTVPQIQDALRKTGLNFIGFSVRPNVAKAFATRFPNATHKTIWTAGTASRRNSPHLRAMYDFWVQKPHAT